MRYELEAAPSVSVQLTPNWPRRDDDDDFSIHALLASTIKETEPSASRWEQIPC